MNLNASNMSSMLSEVFNDCMCKTGEDISTAIKVEGLISDFGFNPDRLNKNKEMIESLLACLPTEFNEGWSFLNFCVDKHGNQWTGEHSQCEKLVVLGLAIDKLEYCAPRDLWAVLPGAVPYIKLK